MAMAICVITQLLFLVSVCATTDQVLFSNATLLKVGKVAIIAVVLMIVAIPEGLPLCVSIAMALSINSLKKDEILIKNLESVQTCAMLHDVCVSKTGTLTKGKLNVMKFHFGDKEKAENNDTEDGPKNFFKKQLDIAPQWRELIIEGIISNTDVRIEVNDALCEYEPCGSAIEVGMIKFLLENEYDVQGKFIERNQKTPKITQLPFDQKLKRKVVARNSLADPNKVRVFVKGAPEYVINLCSNKISSNQDEKEFDQIDRERVLREIVSDSMAKQGLKVLTYAYKEFDSDEFDFSDPDVEGFREYLEKDLTYIATFALDDPLRDSIDESVQFIKYGQVGNLGDAVDGTQVNIRMVTGDHLETAKVVALRAGIITNEQR